MRLQLPATAANRAGAALAFFLGALTVYPWLAPVPADTAAVTRAGAPRQTPPLAAMPPLTRFSAVFDRPLFSASRRPAAAAIAANAGSGAVANYRLIGVVDMPGLRHALVSDGGRTREVREGDTLGSWTIAQIEHEGLVLSSATGRITLPLRPNRAIGPEAPAATAPRP